MKLGDAFQIDDGEGKRSHLRIVISAPLPDGSLITVNCTTRKQGSDASCILQAGDHPFIRHETVIAYEHTRALPLAMQTRIDAAVPPACVHHAPVSPAVLQRIQSGALISDETPQKLQAALRAQGVK